MKYNTKKEKHNQEHYMASLQGHCYVQTTTQHSTFSFQRLQHNDMIATKILYIHYSVKKKPLSILLSDPAGVEDTDVTATTSVAVPRDKTEVNGGRLAATAEEVLVGGAAIKGETVTEEVTTRGSVSQESEVDVVVTFTTEKKSRFYQPTGREKDPASESRTSASEKRKLGSLPL